MASCRYHYVSGDQRLVVLLQWQVTEIDEFVAELSFDIIETVGDRVKGLSENRDPEVHLSLVQF